MGIIASNVYAESVLNFWMNKINTIRESKGMISNTEVNEIANKYDYYNKLNIMRDLDVIDDKKFNYLKNLNSARNDFGHEIDKHKPSNTTQIEKELDNDEIIKLVENLFEDYQERFKDWVNRMASQNNGN